MKVKLNLSNFNSDFQSDSEISNLNSTSDSLIPIGKSGIHIKKENRGKFTEYCGGKVTDACIRKAKASGNPKLVKRATFAANARKWKHQEGGLLISDVDTRSDTTRQGYHEGLPAYGAADASNTAGLWDLMNHKVVSGDVITGEPTLLPGRINNVLAMEKEAPTIFKMLSENPKGMRDLLQEFKIGTGTAWSRVYKPFNAMGRKIKTFLETGDKSLLREIEEWAIRNKNILIKPKQATVTPKGYVQGNEVTPPSRYPISEEGLTVRTARPVKLENPVTNEAEAAAAKDWLTEQGYEYKPVKLVKRTKPAEAVKQQQSQPVTKVEQSAAKVKPNERYTDRRDYTKAQRRSDKYEQTYQDGKATHSNSGTNKVSNSQLREAETTIRKYYPSWSKKLDRIDIRLQNATNPDVIKRIKAERRDFLRSFFNRGKKQ